MKKIVTTSVFAFLAVIGYYIASAAAGDGKNANVSSNEPMGVMVVEEEYGIVTEPANASTTNSKNHNSDKTHNEMHKATGKNHNTQNNGGMMVEEEISETEN